VWTWFFRLASPPHFYALAGTLSYWLLVPAFILLGMGAFGGLILAPPDYQQGDAFARDSSNAAIARWYSYGFTSHMLSPGGRVYGIRTADGRYAKLELLGYYCPGPVAGCVTIRYSFQPRGGPAVGEGAYVEAPAAPDAGRSR
jgi:hypothetical protein